MYACCPSGSSLGYDKIIIETDAQELMKAITSTDQDLVPTGVLFWEIKACLASHFSVFKIMHCPRLCNNFPRKKKDRVIIKATDALATFGVKMDVEPQAVCSGGAPTFIRDLVVSDICVAL